MADKHARTLTQPSNRAKPKDAREKKVVFKGVLENPFCIQWPAIPPNLQNAILANILQLLEGASEYQHERFTSGRKRKRSESLSDLNIAAQNSGASNSKGDMGLDPPIPTGQEKEVAQKNKRPEAETSKPPLLLQHLVYGINAVTKRLEHQTHAARRPIIATVPELSPAESLAPLKHIFVCRADVDPALLIDHLPHLVAAYNSTRPAEHARLVQLPKGSELPLAQSLGIRRVTVVGVDALYPDHKPLKSLMQNVPVIAASWLSQAEPSRSLIPTRVKQLRTTAPKDMKAAKESRNREKALVKKRKQLGNEGKNTK